MKKVLNIFLSLFVAGAFSFASADEIDVDILVKNQWECEGGYEDKEAGIFFKEKTVDIYTKDNTASSIGTFEVKLPQEVLLVMLAYSDPEIENYLDSGKDIQELAKKLPDEFIIYTLSINGSYEVKGEDIIYTLQTVEIKNMSHPEFGDFLDLEKLPAGNHKSLSYKVTKFSDKEIVFQEKFTGIPVNCKAVRR